MKIAVLVVLFSSLVVLSVALTQDEEFQDGPLETPNNDIEAKFDSIEDEEFDGYYVNVDI